MIEAPLEEADKPIEVRVSVNEYRVGPNKQLDIGVWETMLYEKLKAAGIPVLPDGTVERGSLASFNDPKDFGATIYKWLP